MRKLLLFFVVVLISGNIMAQTNENSVADGVLFMYKSQNSVDVTIQRLEVNLLALHIPVFAKINHSKNAEDAGMTLRPNQELIFGSPKVGTRLMQENPAVSVMLPLRISVWENNIGEVWITFPQMKPIAKDFKLEDNPIIGKLQELLESLTLNAATK